MSAATDESGVAAAAVFTQWSADARRTRRRSRSRAARCARRRRLSATGPPTPRTGRSPRTNECAIG
eukprot:6335394-Pyramimonas_sp.AAC.1